MKTRHPGLSGMNMTDYASVCLTVSLPVAAAQYLLRYGAVRISRGKVRCTIDSLNAGRPIHVLALTTRRRCRLPARQPPFQDPDRQRLSLARSPQTAGAAAETALLVLCCGLWALHTYNKTLWG